jgi:hypothetical protein
LWIILHPMALKLLSSAPRANAKAAAARVRDAFEAAKSRTGGEGRLVAICAGGMFLAFVLLAVLAPFLMRAPALVSSIFGFVLFAMVFGFTIVGSVALWRIVRVGASDAQAEVNQRGSIYSQFAIDAALSDAEDGGLKQIGSRNVLDAMTGRVGGRAIAVMRTNEATIAVIRLKEPAPAILIMAPGDQPWPFPLPKDDKLTPIPPPKRLDMTAWSSDREAGMTLAVRLGPALQMSAAGGEIPFVSIRDRALVLMWRGGDVGTASVIAGEVVKGLG